MMDIGALGRGIRLGPHRQQVAARIAAIIADDDPELTEISEDLTRLYREHIPGYDQVDPTSIERNTRAVLAIAVQQLRSESVDADFSELARLARAWSDQQIPLDLVAHSLQLGARRIVEIIRQRATAEHLPAGAVDDIQDLTWEWATAASATVHMVSQERVIATAARRADFLRRLVHGGLSPEEIREAARVHRVDPDHNYRIACVPWEEQRSDSDLLAALRNRGSTAKLPVVDTVVDQYLVALLPRTPDGLAHSGPIALGPAVQLGDAPRSYRYARNALAIAVTHGRSGLVDLASLGPLPLLGAAEDAADQLADKHLTPLDRHGAVGVEIRTTVETYLDCDRRIDDTAEALFLHRNTVRNRLTRFSDLTGLDLDRTNDLIVAWWLLNRTR